MNKVFQGLYCDGGMALVYYSQAVSIGQANSAMIEGWLISASLANAVKLTLEGSNDGQVWTPILNTSGSGPTNIEISLGTAAPDYDQTSNLTCIIGFGQLRIRVDLVNVADKCVLDASIRTFQTA